MYRQLADGSEAAEELAAGAFRFPTDVTPDGKTLVFRLGNNSPEQARGSAVDTRTDIWAFGCCLYEALTGEKPFIGKTVTDTLAAVVRAEPDWTPLPAETPEAVRRFLRRSLEKDRHERVPDIAVVRLEFKEALVAPAQPLVAATPAVSTAEGGYLDL